MLTTEALKAKIRSVEDLQSVVKTMKALAAVQIRQYEKAVKALADYHQTVELGLQVVLKQQYFAEDCWINFNQNTDLSLEKSQIGIIVFGSDQGLCGQFNEQITSYTIDYLQQQSFSFNLLQIAAVGMRVLPALEATTGLSIEPLFSLPSSATGITEKVQEVLLTIEEWQSEKQINTIFLFYNQSQSSASYQPRHLQLLPLDLSELKRLEQQPWKTEMMPLFTMDFQSLFSALTRQYLFVSLYRAFAESLASENASRLSSMQAAERNIKERLENLNAEYRHQRQSSITEELLDIASGFEALTQSKKNAPKIRN
jgi:F-type H+-transporting ATPase subunit gamma